MFTAGPRGRSGGGTAHARVRSDPRGDRTCQRAVLALYATLRPEHSGLGCPLCGDEVGYTNRTARDRGTLECPTCAWDGGADETTGYTPPDAQEEGAGPSGGGATHDGEAGTDVVPSPPGEDTPHTPLRTVIGGALIGGAMGLALVMWARRR
jgi:predicted RNA-binding Zn-ribbon protein involved in translation (DUF1610 family)